jgi:acyl-CoA thioester hydrolase
MFETKLRVRLSETDSLGVAYYGNYYIYFDISRLELLRTLGITPAVLQRRGMGFVAGESTCRYHASAKFDDVLTVAVRVARIGNSSVAYLHSISKGKTRIAEGRVTDVLVDTAGKPLKIPQDIRRKLQRNMVSTTTR